MVVGVLPCPVPMSEGGDVEVCGHLAHLNAAVHPTCRALMYSIVRGPEISMARWRRPGKQSSES